MKYFIEQIELTLLEFMRKLYKFANFAMSVGGRSDIFNHEESQLIMTQDASKPSFGGIVTSYQRKSISYFSRKELLPCLKVSNALEGISLLGISH